MSENLNEMVRVLVQDSSVITVPIDNTLSNSGEAADAKAVGDALDLKADKSELQTAVTVNGQSADAQGKILVTANDTKMSSSDNTTVKAAIEAVDAKSAADIRVSSDPTSQTIAQALASGATRTADQIEMTASDTSTVKSHIDTLTGSVSNLSDAVTALDNKTAATIKYNTGSDETIKQHIEAMESGTVKTVNEISPDANGNIEITRVPYADNLYSDDGEQVDDSFLVRTTAGSGSLSDGFAWAQKLLGNSVHTGFTAESITMTVNAIPRTTPPAITVSIDQEEFAEAAGTAGTYEFNYTTDWDVDPEDYGLTVTNEPVNGDKITVVWDGTNDATASVTAGPRTAPPAITATIDRDTFVAYVSTSGTTTLTYTTTWSADPANYGITVTNDPVAGDQIVVVYVKEVRGTITVAEPTRLVGTGWNLYDHSKGYARAVKYSDTYGYKISGTYTSISFAETPTGSQTTITPVDGAFNVTKDGYILVNGGNSTDTAIWTTWSDWTSSYDGSWKAYSESAVSLATIMTSNFPYGLCKVSTVCDEIDFVHKQAISRITRMAYTAENLESVKAAGRAYEYDENYIYQVRASEVTAAITVEEEYAVSEHGIEFFDGSDIEIYAEILYGANLKDKLKRDVVTISQQELTSGQQAQVRENIGAAEALTAAHTDEVGIVIVGNKTTHTGGASKDQYVILRDSTITGRTDGLYKAAKAIPANTALDSSYLTAVDGGIGSEVASLNEQITTLNGKIKKWTLLLTDFNPTEGMEKTVASMADYDELLICLVSSSRIRQTYTAPLIMIPSTGGTCFPDFYFAGSRLYLQINKTSDTKLVFSDIGASGGTSTWSNTALRIYIK